MWLTIFEKVSFCIIFVFLLIDIILSSINLYNQELESVFYKELNDNWNAMPIYSLSATKGSCINGKPLILDIWPGTMEGCDCIDLFSFRIPVYYRNKVSRVSCSYNMTLAGCEKVEPIPPQDIIHWRENKICAEYDNDGRSYPSFLSLLEDDNSKCPTGYKICGFLDYWNHYMCVRTDENCPINDIIINTQSSYTEKDYSYTTVPLQESVASNPVYLHYTNQAIENHIITKFTLSEGPVCAYNSELNTNYDPFVLDRNYYRYQKKCKKSYNSDLYDPRYLPLDEILKEKLYKQNEIYDIVTNARKLPGYPINSLEAKVILSYRSYFGFLKSCLDKKKFDSNSIQIINDKRNTAHKITIAIVVFVSVGLATHLTFGIIQCACCKKPELFLYHQIAMVCFHLIGFSLSVAAFSILNTIDLHINCWDEYSNFGLLNATSVLRRTINFNIVILSFCILPILPFIVWIFSLVWEKYQPRKENNVQPQIQLQNVQIAPSTSQIPREKASSNVYKNNNKICTNPDVITHVNPVNLQGDKISQLNYDQVINGQPIQSAPNPALNIEENPNKDDINQDHMNIINPPS